MTRSFSLPSPKQLLLIGIIFTALGLRGLFLAETFSKIEFNHLLKGVDQHGFHNTALEIAKNNDWLLKGQEYSQAPFYTYFIAALYKIFPSDVRTVRIVQALLGTAISTIIYLVCLRLFSPLISFLCAFLYACYNFAICFESVLLRATLIGFFHIIVLFFLIKYAESEKKLFLACAGIALGLNIATRPNALLLVPFILLAFRAFPGIRKKRELIKIYILFLFFTALPTIPFIARNIALGYPPLHFSSQGLGVFVAGNMPDSFPAGWKISPMGKDLLAHAQGDVKEIFTGVIREALLNPGSWLLSQTRKVLAFLNAYECPNNNNMYLMSAFSNTLRFSPVDLHIILVFFIPGFILGLRKRSYRGIIYGIFLGIFFSIMIFYILGRFRLPMVGMMCVFAGFTFQEIHDDIKYKRFIRLCILILFASFLASFVRIKEKNIIKMNDLYNFGLIHKQNNNFAEAEFFFERSLDAGPKYFKAAKQLIPLYLRSGQNEKAKQVALKQIQLTPNNVEAIALLGYIYTERGEFSQARYILKGLINKAPEFAKAYFYLGVLEMKAANLTEALRLFQKTLEIDGSINETRKNIDYIERILGKQSKI